MTHNSERFREGATTFRNLRDVAEKRRNELVDQAKYTARIALTESLSTAFTDNRISLSVRHESKLDTSADKLAIEETTTKRSRHMPRAQSRHDLVTSQPPILSTCNVLLHFSARVRHTVNNSVTPRHITPRIDDVASHSNTRSGPAIGDVVEEPTNQSRPSQKLAVSRHAPDDRTRK
jgi:hypothetical protein